MRKILPLFVISVPLLNFCIWVIVLIRYLPYDIDIAHTGRVFAIFYLCVSATHLLFAFIFFIRKCKKFNNYETHSKILSSAFDINRINTFLQLFLVIIGGFQILIIPATIGVFSIIFGEVLLLRHDKYQLKVKT